MERALRESGRRLQAWLHRYPRLEVAFVLGEFGAVVLALVVVVRLLDLIPANPILAWAVVAALFAGDFISSHYARRRRREAAAKQAEQLKRDHPDLAAVIEILETYRSSADGDAALGGLIQNLLFFAAGIAVPYLLPYVLPAILAKLQAP